jgi:hypothetical protein
MKLICKACNGSGQAVSPEQLDKQFSEFLGGSAHHCRACRGAGELILAGAENRYVPCETCEGEGVNKQLPVSSSGPAICSACRGAGTVRRKMVSQKGQAAAPATMHGPLPRLVTFEADVALSVSTDNRKAVEPFYKLLTGKGLRIFLDTNPHAELRGAEFYAKLDELYRLTALVSVLFLSTQYAAQRWTGNDRRLAQTRAFTENKDYVISVRLDDTELPGLTEAVRYVDMAKFSADALAQLTLETIEKEKKRLASTM